MRFSPAVLVISATVEHTTYVQGDRCRLEYRLSEGKLDEPLFEVPAGFKQVAHLEYNARPPQRASPLLEWARFQWKRMLD